MRVSVVIATFNRLALLKELLQSLTTQTLGRERWEVIIVDDGSREPVAPSLGEYPFTLHVLTQANAGVAAARHNGIMRASGDVIIVTDDDMLLPPDFIAAHLHAHEAGNTLVLGHIAPPPDSDDKPLFERMHTNQLNKFIAHRKDHPKGVIGVNVCTGNVSFRRADYIAVGGFDRTLKRSEDRDLGVRLEQAGAKLTFAYDAKTINRSDHTDFDKWMKSNFNYGIYDSRIAKKNSDVQTADPWRYFFLVNPVSRLLLAATVAAPTPMGVVARLAYRVANALDQRGIEKPALAGATLCYGIEYFRGVREEAGSFIDALRGLRAYLSKR